MKRVQFTGKNFNEIDDFTANKLFLKGVDNKPLMVGKIKLLVGDWLVNNNGKFHKKLN